MTRILFVGDVVGEPGRKTLHEVVPRLQERHTPDFIVVNGENVAGGMGITEKTARSIFSAGADAITLGNHTYRHREVYGYLQREEKIIRPANHHPSSPGRGHTIVEKNGVRLGVINLSGVMTMNVAASPFDTVDAILQQMDGQADIVLVDFHAETTSEKIAMGWHLDGRVAAVVGTHTHVPTADARVLPQGTAFVSDVGMTGSRAGVLGVKKEAIISRLRTGLPVKFESATGDEYLMGALVDVGRDGKATGILQVLEPLTVDEVGG